MSFSRLQEILLSKIQDYLKYDNPEPASDDGLIDGVVNSICAIFKAEGRKRAERYQEIIRSTSNEVQLAREVFNDLRDSQNSRLETSKDLRQRIFDGLCDFFKVSSAIHDQPYLLPSYVSYPGSALFAGLYNQNQNEVLKRKQMNVLREKVEALLKTENVENYTLRSAMR